MNCFWRCTPRSWRRFEARILKMLTSLDVSRSATLLEPLLTSTIILKYCHQWVRKMHAHYPFGFYSSPQIVDAMPPMYTSITLLRNKRTNLLVGMLLSHATSQAMTIWRGLSSIFCIVTTGDGGGSATWIAFEYATIHCYVICDLWKRTTQGELFMQHAERLHRRPHLLRHLRCLRRTKLGLVPLRK